MAEKIPRPPAGLRGSGRALWRAVLNHYELDEHETTILREACRTADSLDGLQTLLENEGLISESSQGSRVHPALVELRQQRITFARLLTALRIPAGETPVIGRTQHRGGPRGVYGITGGAS
ncbi:terminase [Pedococcus sp. 5OH_020]|uniref:terminase n=1 Tax=Pedococcus sp. 5OH_020 TaxID=2989814 RepID=UPI0022E9BE71|nr:terminase [Pedococcus sp. 5OH_020]